MTCRDALVLSETARLHLALTSLASTAQVWRMHLTADEPLKQLICLAMSAREPLLLARLCAVLLNLLHDRTLVYHLVGNCHFASILAHLIETEAAPVLGAAAAMSSMGNKSSYIGGNGGETAAAAAAAAEEEQDAVVAAAAQVAVNRGQGLGAARTPWSRSSARGFGSLTATLADTVRLPFLTFLPQRSSDLSLTSGLLRACAAIRRRFDFVRPAANALHCTGDRRSTVADCNPRCSSCCTVLRSSPFTVPPQWSASTTLNINNRNQRTPRRRGRRAGAEITAHRWWLYGRRRRWVRSRRCRGL